MVPTNFCFQIIRFSVFCIIVWGSEFLVLYFICPAYYESKLTFFYDLFRVGSATKNSSFDFGVFVTLCLCIYLVHFIVLIVLILDKKPLSKAYNFIKESANISLPVILDLKKKFNWHLVKVGFIYLIMSCFIAGMAINIVDEFDLNLLSFLPSVIGWVLGTAISFAPLFAFHFFFLDASLVLYSWILSMKLKLTLSEFPYQHLNECRLLQLGLELFNEAITKMIFWFFLVIMIFSILEIYLIMSYFLASQEFTLGIVLVIIGYGSYGILFLFFAHAYCTFSQIIKDSIDQIRKITLEMDVPNEGLLILDAKKYNPRHARKIVVVGFDEFQGFHGNGYFILGKPFLTSIIANFMTYLIILIQFKVSQPSL